MTSTKPSKEQLFSEAIEAEARSGIRILAVLAFCLFPVFTVLDYFTQHENYGVLSLIRFATTLFFFVMHLLFRKNFALKNPILTSNCLLAVASFSITLMCMSLTGSTSPYYAGVNLVVLAGVLILPINAPSMLKTVAMIVGIYVAGIMSVEGSAVNVPALFNNLSFLIATGVIGATAAHLKYKLRKEAFFRNLEIERSVEVLQNDLHETGGGDIEGLAKQMVDKKTEVQNALAIRDGFISMASHELRSPLTSMKLQMDIALMKLKHNEIDKEIIQKSISNAYRQIHNISRLVDEMLDVSRIQSGKFIIEKSSVELNDLVSGVLLRYYSEHLSGRKLKHLYCPDVLKGEWDPFKLEQVVVNLINNAVRYGDGSEVKLETSKEGSFAAVIVSDKGPGIHPEEQAKIFEKFERGQTAKSGGLGLGLYICKEIVEGHSGKITLVSVPGAGTTFKVLLPLS